MSLLISSNDPIEIKRNGVTKVYDKYLIERASVNVSQDKVGLIVWFKRCTAEGELYPEEAISYCIEDILTDEATASASASFFQALVTKAMTAQVIS